MIQHRRRPPDAMFRPPAVAISERAHAKPTDGIRAGLRAIYEPQDCPSERLRKLLQMLQQGNLIG